jgi:pyrroloquinoline quinone biosynthesis protein D
MSAAGSASALEGASLPRLPRGVRLKRDETRQAWVLLAPERVVNCNAIAAEVLKRCTGAATLDAIVDDLAAAFKADRARVDMDVRTLLTELMGKRMIDL